MNRRDFVAAAVGGASLLTTLNGSVFERLNALAGGSPPSTLVRQNIYCLTDKSPQVVAYRKAIAIMRAKPATDPTSWMAQANVHGTFMPPPGMITNACEHGTRFFFSWHRMYLYYFERIVRAASGDPTFALPYWGYSPTGQRDLPAIFRTPATAANVLYMARNTSVNAGSALAPSLVDPGVAFGKGVFDAFSTSLEGTPHGAVHVAVGGNMGSVPTAAQDPIFWLHHCNIDRLWETWRAADASHTNPTDSTWLSTPYQFYDETGATVTMTASQILDTAAQLNYRYGGPSCLKVVRPFDIYTRVQAIDPRILELIRTIRVRPPRPSPLPVAQSTAIRLGTRPLGVPITMSAANAQILARFPTDKAGGRAMELVLDNIQASRAPDVYYEIYLNLPSNVADTSYTSPYYVGNLDLFGIAGQPDTHAKDREAARRRVLDILPTYAKLRALGAWRDNAMRVTFVPKAFTEEEQAKQMPADAVRVTIGRTSLTLR